MAEYTVANVVGTISYQQELDLSELSDTFSQRKEIASVTYEPVKNHWLMTYFEPDDTYVAFYRGGRCSIAGCQSTDHFHEVAERVNTVMRNLLQFEYTPNVEVSNIVATADVELTTPLEVVALELGMEKSEYEPEQFPAIMYRNSDYVILLFASGKLLCTGLSDLSSVSTAIEEIKARIQRIA